jgi:hypothetical protein
MYEVALVLEVGERFPFWNDAAPAMEPGICGISARELPHSSQNQD